MFVFYETVARDVISKIDSGKILEIGTGFGHLAIEIARQSPQVEVVGVDVSESAVRAAEARSIEVSSRGRVKFKVETAYALSFPDCSFDLVISTGTLHHLKNPLSVFNEMYRVLKPQSEAWIYDGRTDASIEEIAATLKEFNVPIPAPLVRTILPYMQAGLGMMEYKSTGIETVLTKCLFPAYKIDKQNALMKITLAKSKEAPPTPQ